MKNAKREIKVRTCFSLLLLPAAFCLFFLSGCGGHSTTTGETGALYIETRPSGAVISLDGAQKGTSPLTLQLPEGTYKIKAAKALSADTEADAVVKGKQTTTVTIILNPDANVPGQPTLAE